MSRLSNNNAQGEYYLTDVIAMAVAMAWWWPPSSRPDGSAGRQRPRQLAELERHYQLREGRRLMAQGVTLRDPARFDVRGEVTVGRDVLIDINVILEGKRGHRRRRGDRPELRDQGQHPAQRRGGQGQQPSRRRGHGRGQRCRPIRPLAPWQRAGAKAHVGNFVELKNAHLGKAPRPAT
jgi:bifunctional UDP-N-acetylglucosamine pyrophosphorylase/glucosamine-1-phosphate N-acetyltransferase